MFCELFGYSKQAYYKKHKQVRKTDHPQADAIKAMVMGIGQQMPRLGTRKLYFLLKEPFRKQAIKIGRDGLFTLLRTYNLLVDKKKKSSQTTHSKQIMGYELSTNMEAIYTLNALKMALTKRQYTDSALIHHSDRGIQYCSKVYTQVLTENNITISMTENGDPYENAIAERVNGILKDELGLGECFEDIAACKLQTRQSIDIYNHQRPHLSCHMLAPVQMHQQQELKVKTWQKKTSTKPRLSGSA